ncbi:MAG: hypothetical protein AAGA99_00700 [Actinomycetota bacterium]
MVDDALDELYRHEERPASATLSAALGGTATDTTVVVSDVSLFQVTNVVEVGSELMLVTAIVSSELTLSRGYAGTTRAAHESGAEIRRQPRFGRAAVAEKVYRSLGAMETWVYPLVSEEYSTTDTATLFVELPSNTVNVERVRYQDPTTGRIIDLPGWEFHFDLPTTVAESTVALQVPSRVRTTDSLIVTRRISYRWRDTSESSGSGDVYTTDPIEEDTVDLPIAGQDLPSAWAAASVALGRELSRQDLDRVPEWSEEAARAQGVNLRLVRELYGNFYRRIDEVQRTYPRYNYRPFRKMGRA